MTEGQNDWELKQVMAEAILVANQMHPDDSQKAEKQAHDLYLAGPETIKALREQQGSVKKGTLRPSVGLQNEPDNSGFSKEDALKFIDECSPWERRKIKHINEIKKAGGVPIIGGVYRPDL